MHRGQPPTPVEPQAFGDHPLAQGLARDPAAVQLAELLAGQRRAEVGVASGSRLLLGRPRRLDSKLTAPRSRKPRSKRNTCRRCSPSRVQASAILMRPASRFRITSSRAHSLSLIDTTAIRSVLPQPRHAGECRLSFAQGCHLYIAPTNTASRKRLYGTRLSTRFVTSASISVGSGTVAPPSSSVLTAASPTPAAKPSSVSARPRSTDTRLLPLNPWAPSLRKPFEPPPTSRPTENIA